MMSFNFLWLFDLLHLNSTSSLSLRAHCSAMMSRVFGIDLQPDYILKSERIPITLLSGLEGYVLYIKDTFEYTVEIDTFGDVRAVYRLQYHQPYSSAVSVPEYNTDSNVATLEYSYDGENLVIIPRLQDHTGDKIILPDACAIRREGESVEAYYNLDGIERIPLYINPQGRLLVDIDIGWCNITYTINKAFNSIKVK
jgi:hypothetical protein